ncbi:MAG TPA: hypothetical protein VIH46_08910 [Candidatus Acidoferrales bacterium]
MARSGGITFSAVVVFLGSAFTILCGGFAVLGSFIASHSELGTSAPIDFRFVAIFEAIFYLGFGVWGIASGIGLIKTRQWARISMLAFSGILILFSLPVVLVIAAARFPQSSDPSLPANFMVIMRVSMAAIFVLIAALGGFWLYFFNKKSVKAQFLGALSPGEEIVPDSSGRRPTARPMSITIIGWFLLIASGLTSLFVLFFRGFFPGQSIPFSFFGFFLFGRRAILTIVAWMAAQFVAAVGLLKLRNWGRVVTIWLQVLGIANSLLTFGLPANRVRFQQIMETMMASTNPRLPQPFSPPVWIGVVASAPIVFVFLWFLFREKRAFLVSEH